MTDESFLSRWSRLKRKEADAPQPAPEPAAPPLAVADPAIIEPAGTDPAAPPADGAEAAEDEALKDLPPVESLTAESDFTPFMRAGVPEDLHRQALRKLWTSDPVYANDDGLKDYAGDYTGLFSGSGVVKTAYRVGKGFLDAVEEAAERAEEAAASAGPAAQDEASNAAGPAPESPDANGDMINKT